MEEENLVDSVRVYFRLLREWLWLVVLVSMVSATAAFLISRSMPPVYEATTLVYINNTGDARAIDLGMVQASQRLASAYTEMLKTDTVLAQIIQEANLSISPPQLRSRIRISTLRDTSLMSISVQDQDPQQAAKIANTVFAVFLTLNERMNTSRFNQSLTNLETQKAEILQKINDLKAVPAQQRTDIDRQLQAQYEQTFTSLLQSIEQINISKTTSSASIYQADIAVPATNKVAPKVLDNTLIAGFLGLFISVAGVFLYEQMRDIYHSTDELAKDLGLPILGTVPQYRVEEGKLVSLSEPRSPAAEAFRYVRTSIQYAEVDNPIQLILVTSPLPNDGKSTVTANLGVAVAQSDKNVLVLDADMHLPTLHKRFGLLNSHGLSELFIKSKHGQQPTHPIENAPGLQVLTSGNPPPNPSELLGSARMTDWLNTLRGQHDLVLLDSPPVMAVSDTLVLAPKVDGVILVLRLRQTKCAAARQSVKDLRRVGARLLGVVVNGTTAQDRGHYYSNRYYTAQATSAKFTLPGFFKKNPPKPVESILRQSKS